MSRFTASLGLRLIEDAQGRPITRGGRVQWQVIDDLPYEVGSEGSGVTIYVEKGCTTDLASIPRIAWSLLPPDGPWTKAAVLHDALYRLRGEVARLGHPKPFTRQEADAIFAEAMTVTGVSDTSRDLIWRACRIGGKRGWGS